MSERSLQQEGGRRSGEQEWGRTIAARWATARRRVTGRRKRRTHRLSSVVETEEQNLGVLVHEPCRTSKTSKEGAVSELDGRSRGGRGEAGRQKRGHGPSWASTSKNQFCAGGEQDQVSHEWLLLCSLTVTHEDEHDCERVEKKGKGEGGVDLSLAAPEGPGQRTGCELRQVTVCYVHVTIPRE